ncbi:GFA family protein [Mesorhizobium sp. BAC0120]|uniref:GFA family protein n=1 Tax=Mesorhizobium sp. BAC0120 TaxID=3090670 RepID=UPI00298BE598|nr:GFA family protein [Mesorhizobium sp. BAC0120]MDW6024633.1 GFA family protein [Mesorhizobium sp. BAC0120]
MTAQRYTGGCQCGAVRYEVTVDLDHTIACNCSRCGRLGSILTFAPTESFTLLSGEESLTDFQFNKHVIHHLFCKVCGIESFSRGTKPDGTEMVAINARCLDGIDVFALNPAKFDGRGS